MTFDMDEMARRIKENIHEFEWSPPYKVIGNTGMRGNVVDTSYQILNSRNELIAKVDAFATGNGIVSRLNA